MRKSSDFQQYQVETNAELCDFFGDPTRTAAEVPPYSLYTRFWSEWGTIHVLRGRPAEAKAAFTEAVKWGWCFDHPTPPDGWQPMGRAGWGSPREAIKFQVDTACAATLAGSLDWAKRLLEFIVVNADDTLQGPKKYPDQRTHGQTLMWRAFAQLGGAGEFSPESLGQLMAARDLLASNFKRGRTFQSAYQADVLIPRVLVAVAERRLGRDVDVTQPLAQLVDGVKENPMKLMGWFYRLAFEALFHECRSTAN